MNLFDVADPLPRVDNGSIPRDKVDLFRALFVGRNDVYAVRWENERTGKSGWAPAVEGGWPAARRSGRHYLPLTDEVIAAHLSGRVMVGLYPLMADDACRLLVCDFDGDGWVLDSLAYLDAGARAGVPMVVERSRSGNGGHVWTFFSGPVPASTARRLGAALLREAMATRAELDLVSYDRLFPTQDYVPKGSFGNLIALPLDGESLRRGNTLFLDASSLEPVEDQWAYLSSLPRLSPEAVASLVGSLRSVEMGPATAVSFDDRAENAPLPDPVRAEIGAMVDLERIGLPPWMLASLKHLAALHNPEFHERQRLRLSTWRIPRFIRCYEETLDRLRLPRGLLPRIEELVTAAGSRLELTDRRPTPSSVALSFAAELTAQQSEAVDALTPHELGVLVAPPGTGKTVMACALIARRALPTLVIVDRQTLLDQWLDRVRLLLGLPADQIGRLGAGHSISNGVVDVAMVQSLARSEDLEDITSGYGLVIVDECHHVPAVMFEAVVKRVPARCWLGLTATPYRRDKLEDILILHCGPVRHEIDASAAPSASLDLSLVVHETRYRSADADPHIQEVFRGLVEDEERTSGICIDVTEAARGGRNCLVLTQWTKHLELIREGLEARGLGPLVLRGGMGKPARTAVLDELAHPGDGPLVLLATGSYVGEGFDCPILDTLFLTFPIAFKGRIVQYVGRVLRVTDDKRDVEVHDYVDVKVPVLARMHNKRRETFELLGFRVGTRPQRRRS